MHLPSRSLLALALALGTLTGAGLAQAQAVYRIVGPDGKVTFSDRAPAEDASPAKSATSSARPDAANAALPYALRQVAARFPVTLYTSADCAPCASARNFLLGRGVPFAERSISSNADIDALTRLSGNTSLPFATLGGQHLSGFSDSEWTQYLDAAGYPKKSELPSTYRPPAATPLVAVQPLAAPPADPAQAPRPERPAPAPAPAPSGPGPGNPAGIRF